MAVKANKDVNDNTLKRKMLLSVLGSPVTLLPVMAGVTAFLGSWMLGFRQDLGALGLLAGLLGGAGMFVTNLLVGGESYAKEAIEEEREKAGLEREAALDALDRRLAEDGDPRDESALRDLRSLAAALEELSELGAIDLEAANVIEIRAGMAQLFDRCVAHLERILVLRDMAEKMTTKAARKPIDEQRDEIMAEIFESVKTLGKMLMDLQGLGDSDSTRELSRIREEMDQNLKVARKVDERLQDFESQFSPRGVER
jgi:hypothetical protein